VQTFPGPPACPPAKSTWQSLASAGASCAARISRAEPVRIVRNPTGLRTSPSSGRRKGGRCFPSAWTRPPNRDASHSKRRVIQARLRRLRGFAVRTFGLERQSAQSVPTRLRIDPDPRAVGNQKSRNQARSRHLPTPVANAPPHLGGFVTRETADAGVQGPEEAVDTYRGRALHRRPRPADRRVRPARNAAGKPARRHRRLRDRPDHRTS
jgi:hypothetical protein